MRRVAPLARRSCRSTVPTSRRAPRCRRARRYGGYRAFASATAASCASCRGKAEAPARLRGRTGQGPERRSGRTGDACNRDALADDAIVRIALAKTSAAAVAGGGAIGVARATSKRLDGAVLIERSRCAHALVHRIIVGRRVRSTYRIVASVWLCPRARDAACRQCVLVILLRHEPRGPGARNPRTSARSRATGGDAQRRPENGDKDVEESVTRDGSVAASLVLLSESLLVGVTTHSAPPLRTGGRNHRIVRRRRMRR